MAIAAEHSIKPASQAGTAPLKVPFLMLPALVFVLVSLFLPLALMFRYSLNRFDPTELMISAVSLENYQKFFGDSFYQHVLFTTVWISLSATLVCLAIGFPVAYALTRYVSDRLRSRLLILIILPLFMGNAVRTAAWMIIAGDRGVLAAIWSAAGFGSLKLMYTPAAVLIGLISVLMPFMIVTLQSVMEGIDRNLEEAAQGLGSSHFVALRRVVIPLSLPGVLAGSVLCFILSMNAYATPVLIGGPQFHMMAPEVYQQVAKAINWPFGAALAFILMAATLIMTVTANWALQRRYRRWSE